MNPLRGRIRGRIRGGLLLTAAILTGLITVALSGCGSKPDIVGTWSGTVDLSSLTPGMPSEQQPKLTLVCHFKRESGVLSGTIDSPNQEANGVTLNSVALAGERVTFQADKLSMKFDGKLGGEEENIYGTLMMDKHGYALVLKKKETLP